MLEISILRTLALYVFAFLILFSVVFPVTLQFQKAVFLFLIILILVVYIFFNRGKLYLKREVLIFSLFYSTFGLAWSLYGEINSNPGAMSVSTVMVVYPLLFTALVVSWQNKHIHNIQGFFVFISFVLSVSLLLYLLSGSGLISSSYYEFMQGLYEEKSVFDQGENYLLFTHPSVSSLLFFIPFIMVLAFLREKNYLHLFVLFLLMLILIIMTGRRAFFVSFSFALVFFFFVYCFFYKSKVNAISNNKLYFFSFVAFAFIIYIFLNFENFNFNFNVYVDGLLSIFDFSSDASNLERRNQFFSLIEGISKNPFFGSGAGAAADYSRSSDQPWAYELSYIALIFHYGIMGFILYTLGVLYIFLRMLQVIRDKKASNELRVFAFAFLCGFVSFLVANSTNPYLGKFDYMWVIFVPVAIINSYLFERGMSENIHNNC